MKAGKTANDYRQTPWIKKGPDVVDTREPSKVYPMHVPGDLTGNVRIIKSKEEHEAYLGGPVDDNGNPIAPQPEAVVQTGQVEPAETLQE